MEKAYFSDYVKLDPKDDALKVIADLQKRYPASSFVNIFYLKLQPNRVQSRNRNRLLLTLPDRARFHQLSVAEAPVVQSYKDTPRPALVEVPKTVQQDDLHPVFVKGNSTENQNRQDLINQLIEKFTKDAPKIIYTPENHDAEANYGEESLVEDPNIVSETLANIYASQGCVEKAIQMFEILKLHFPEKSCYFADRIKILEIDSQNADN